MDSSIIQNADWEGKKLETIRECEPIFWCYKLTTHNTHIHTQKINTQLLTARETGEWTLIGDDGEFHIYQEYVLS